MSEEQIEETGEETAVHSEDGKPTNEDAKTDDTEEVGAKSENSEKKIFKKTIKVNGRESEFELDLSDEDKLTAIIQKGLAAEERFRSLSQKEKELKSLESELKEIDPKEIFKKRGMSPQEWAEQILIEAIEESNMSEAERELKQIKEERAQREKQVAPLKKQLTQFLRGFGLDEEELKGKSVDELKDLAQAKNNEMERAKESLEKEILDAWKDSGLPQTKAFVLAISQEMYGASQRGEDLSAKEAASIVKENWYGNISETVKGLDASAIQTLFSGIKDALSNLDAEAIQDLLGKDVLKKLNMAGVRRVSDRDLKDIDTKKNRSSKLYSEGMIKKPMTEKEWEATKDKLKRQYA